MSFAQRSLQGNPFNDGTDFQADAVARDFQREFICSEESICYANSLEKLVFRKFQNGCSNPTIVEFGSGTGEPVVSAILNAEFLGTIYGYEINQKSLETADRLIERQNLNERYIVRNISFFESKRIPQCDYLIANPPYIPCEDRNLLTLPDLWGGKDGNDISKRLLSCGYQNVFLEVSSYSDPRSLIYHALSLGYKISDYRITQMPFGIYSRQNVVQKRIYEMKKEGRSFFSDNHYKVGSAFFIKTSDDDLDLSEEFLACLISQDHS